MPMVTANEIKHHVQRLPAKGHTGDGTAPIVVLVHGLLVDSLASYYFTVGPALAAAGFDVIMYDLRGHGRSARPSTGYQLADFLTDLDALLDALGVDVPVHLVGNSFGGTIAFGYAECRPERVASVALVESTPATPSWATQMATTLADGKNKLPKPEAIAWFTEHHGAYVARILRNAGRLLLSSSITEDIPVSDVLSDARIAAVAVPVMVIYGGNAELVGQADWLESLLPSCTTVVIPEQQHWALFTSTALCCELIRDWLCEHSGVLASDSG